jgi:hypothetical protein
MENECIICLDELIDNIVVLSCPHKNHYHYDCLIKWIQQKNTLTKICTICDTYVEIENIINPKDTYTPKKSYIFNCCNIL